MGESICTALEAEEQEFWRRHERMERPLEAGDSDWLLVPEMGDGPRHSPE